MEYLTDTNKESKCSVTTTATTFNNTTNLYVVNNLLG